MTKLKRTSERSKQVKTNHAFENDMQRIAQARATGLASWRGLALETVTACAKHRMLAGRTGADFAREFSYSNEWTDDVDESAELIERFDTIIARYLPKDRR